MNYESFMDGVTTEIMIYSNRSKLCCLSTTPEDSEDIKFQEFNIRDESIIKKIPELHNPRTWEIQGGANNNLYPKEWTRELKRSIKVRDNYTCQICRDEEKIISHHIHHIDYDKQNCCESNLITLCPPCHRKTNKDREYWQEYFMAAYEL